MKSFILSIPNGLLSIIMIVVVMFFTFTSSVNYLRDLFPHAEQFGHMVLYFVTAVVILFDYAKARLPHHTKLNQEIAVAAMSSVLALLMEIALMFRTAGHDDFQSSNVFAATLGAFLGWLFYHYWLLHPIRHYLYHSIQHHWRYQHRRKKKK